MLTEELFQKARKRARHLRGRHLADFEVSLFLDAARNFGIGRFLL